MQTTKKQHAVDMCNGPLFRKIVVFFIPVMLSNMLQLVYNAADQMIVGKFSGATDLAAVGSTAALINLITCLLIGLSVGASSVTARHFGSGNNASLSRAVHTSIALSLLAGVFLGIVGILFSKELLKLMDTPADVLSKASLYMQILFAGLPAMALFNFSSAILRAIGDTKRPMIFMVISGALNVGLNLIFVIALDMAVAGVALATIISQCLAALLTTNCLRKSDETYKLSFRRIKIHKGEFRQIIQIGVPSSIQSASFSLSNVFIQSAVNSFGSAAMAGCTAASIIDNVVYQATNSLYHTTLSFVGQNFGAGKKKRIVQSVVYCTGIVTVVGLTLGILCTVCSKFLLNLFMDKSTDPAFYADAIAYGMQRLKLTLPIYFMCGVLEVGTGALRAMNKSVISMAGSIVGACGLRILWIITVFASNPTIPTLFLSYPITWSLTSLFMYSVFIYYIRKMQNADEKKVE